MSNKKLGHKNYINNNNNNKNNINNNNINNNNSLKKYQLNFYWPYEQQY